jgi:hypothetical protein
MRVHGRGLLRWFGPGATAAAACLVAVGLVGPAQADGIQLPVSNGKSGSFNALFGSGTYLDWFNVDTGQVHSSASGGFIAFTVPFRAVSWNAQKVHLYSFTDMTVQSTVALTIYGSTPAVFAAQKDISFAGQFTILSGSNVGGVAANQVGQYVGAAGGGPGGGGGGGGPGGAVEGAFCGEPLWAAGGGGGGNHLSSLISTASVVSARDAVDETVLLDTPSASAISASVRSR